MKIMASTPLDHYKALFRCQHDGETVLKVAEIGLLSGEAVAQGGHRESYGAFLKEAGIKAEMDRAQVVKCLTNHLAKAVTEKHRSLIRTIVKICYGVKES